MQREHERGFTLIELLIVVAIIGVLAAIAIPNLIAALNRSRQKRTMADMRALAIAWEQRANDVGGYSAAGLSLCCTVNIPAAQITTMISPTFIRTMHETDGWGHTFEFATDADGNAYLIRSYGRDGVRDNSVSGGATSAMDCDLIYSGGGFLQYPEGAQSQ